MSATDETPETAYVAVVPRETTEDYDPAAMGVAVVGVLYDGTVYYFGEDDLPRLFDLLERAERFVGVNDYVVEALEPYTDERTDGDGETDGDLPPFEGVQTRVSDALGQRVSLNNVAKATLGRERDDPRRLPLEWSEGREKTVKRSLKKDLLILRDLDDAIRDDRRVHVTDPRTMEETAVEFDG